MAYVKVTMEFTLETPAGTDNETLVQTFQENLKVLIRREPVGKVTGARSWIYERCKKMRVMV